jgi:hypothetical protein
VCLGDQGADPLQLGERAPEWFLGVGVGKRECRLVRATNRRPAFGSPRMGACDL